MRTGLLTIRLLVLLAICLASRDLSAQMSGAPAGPIQAMYMQPMGTSAGNTYVDAYGNPVVVPASYGPDCSSGDCYGGDCYGGDCYGGLLWRLWLSAGGRLLWRLLRWWLRRLLQLRTAVARWLQRLWRRLRIWRLRLRRLLAGPAARAPTRHFQTTSKTIRCCHPDAPSNAGRTISTCGWKPSR